MNKIVIIGNGFDLAYGWKTKYEDFVLDYFKNAIKYCREEYIDANKLGGLRAVKPYQDKLMTVECILPHKLEDELESVADILEEINIRWEGIKAGNSYGGYYKIKVTSDFFKHLLNQEENLSRWTDIENYYFKYLIEKYEKQKVSIPRDMNVFLRLNEDFEELERKLVDYLKKVNASFDGTTPTNDAKSKMIDYCFNEVSDEDMGTYFNKAKIKVRSYKLEKTYFFNFNYTTLLSNILLDRKNFEKISIHGELEDPKSMVFGYGDDTHVKYKELEQNGDDELLMNIKSFYYANNDLYQNVISILERDAFEVVVVGHSLGLSDRVLLKTIFEHTNCAAIRLCHRGGASAERSHFKKRIALSRHFDDKLAMREKIVSYNAKDIFT